MADLSKIEWCDATLKTGRALGALKAAAKKRDLTLEQYMNKLVAERWCTSCKSWKPHGGFNVDRTRAIGLSASCRGCQSERGRAKYTQKPRPAPGRRFVVARDGDKKQARGRVNSLVAMGLLPTPASVPCHDCGHLGTDSRHEYDHHLGYSAESHEAVQVVCAVCHRRREIERGTYNRQVREGRGRFTRRQP